MKIYTRRGDDGTTGLLYGGRVAKDSPIVEANGAVDEAQAAIGLARAAASGGSDPAELDGLLIGLERDLYVLMAEIGTLPVNRSKLIAGQTLVTADMVSRVERVIDDLAGRFPPIAEFVLPGGGPVSATLDLARTLVRRAERRALEAELGADSHVGRYLNRLSDLLWTMARWQDHRDHGESLPSRPSA